MSWSFSRPGPMALWIIFYLIPSGIIPFGIIPSGIIPSGIIPSRIIPSRIIASRIIPSRIIELTHRGPDPLHSCHVLVLQQARPDGPLIRGEGVVQEPGSAGVEVFVQLLVVLVQKLDRVGASAHNTLPALSWDRRRHLHTGQPC